MPGSRSGPADPLSAAIYDELKSETSAASVLPAERRIIIDRYRQTGFKPLWTTPTGMSGRTRELLFLFKDAENEDSIRRLRRMFWAASMLPKPALSTCGHLAPLRY
jgi:hypothetical protein